MYIYIHIGMYTVCMSMYVCIIIVIIPVISSDDCYCYHCTGDDDEGLGEDEGAERKRGAGCVLMSETQWYFLGLSGSIMGISWEFMGDLIGFSGIWWDLLGNIIGISWEKSWDEWCDWNRGELGI